MGIAAAGQAIGSAIGVGGQIGQAVTQSARRQLAVKTTEVVADGIRTVGENTARQMNDGGMFTLDEALLLSGEAMLFGFGASRLAKPAAPGSVRTRTIDSPNAPIDPGFVSISTGAKGGTKVQSGNISDLALPPLSVERSNSANTGARGATYTKKEKADNHEVGISRAQDA